MSNRLLGRHPLRVLVVVLGLLVVLNLAFFLGREQDSSEEGTDTLPSTVESVNPQPGGQADRRTTVTADLRDDLAGVLVIDGVRIPEDQLGVPFGNPQGIVSFRPGPDFEFTDFEPGTHTVQVLYWPQKEREPSDPDSFGWQFRATA